MRREICLLVALVFVPALICVALRAIRGALGAFEPSQSRCRWFWRNSAWLAVLLISLLILMFPRLVRRREYVGQQSPAPAEVTVLQAALKADVDWVGTNWPGRHILGTDSSNYAHLTNTAHWISSNLAALGRLTVTTQFISGRVSSNSLSPNSYQPGISFGDTWNIIAELPAAVTNQTLPGIIVFGAHYDTMAFNSVWEGTRGRFSADAAGTPGANDNGSGVAALLALARYAALHGTNWTHTVRFVAFANEEPPFFQNREAMGSWLYATQQVQPEEKPRIRAVISLENLANYSAETRNPKRRWAADLVGLSATPNYVAFMSQWAAGSGSVAALWADAYARHSGVNARTVSLPFIACFGTEIFAWSDDWSFTQNGIPAFAVCDTAFYRSARYHEAWDTPENLHDYETFAKVVLGLQGMLNEVALRPGK